MSSIFYNNTYCSIADGNEYSTPAAMNITTLRLEHIKHVKISEISPVTKLYIRNVETIDGLENLVNVTTLRYGFDPYDAYYDIGISEESAIFKNVEMLKTIITSLPNLQVLLVDKILISDEIKTILKKDKLLISFCQN